MLAWLLSLYACSLTTAFHRAILSIANMAECSDTSGMPVSQTISCPPNTDIMIPSIVNAGAGYNSSGSAGYGGRSVGETYTDSGVGSGAVCTGNNRSYSGQDMSGGRVKDSSDTRGAEYDATGGQVDDRTFGQKAKDAFKPGSNVGTHRSPATPS